MTRSTIALRLVAQAGKRIVNAHPKRQFLKHLATLGLLGSSGIPGLIAQALASGGTPARPGIQKISGAVTLNGKVAQQGALVRAGDTLVTGPDSTAIYVIGQDAFLQREKTTVSLTIDPSGAVAGALRVVTGKLLSVFARGNRQIETATATIGIRGTGCYIECEDQRVYFCLCYGSAEIRPLADPQRVERLVTSHHDRPVYIHRDSALPVMADAGMINHQDAELELVEGLVGRVPPFSKGSYRY